MTSQAASKTPLQELKERIDKERRLSVTWHYKIASGDSSSGPFFGQGKTFEDAKVDACRSMLAQLSPSTQANENPSSALNEAAMKHRLSLHYFINAQEDSTGVASDWVVLNSMVDKAGQQEAAKALLQKLPGSLLSSDLPAPSTPLAVLNELMQKDIVRIIEMRADNQASQGAAVFSVFLEAEVLVNRLLRQGPAPIAPISFTQEYLSIKSKTYLGVDKTALQHRAALHFMKQACILNDEVWRRYSLLKLEPVLRFGDNHWLQESISCEFKSSSDPSTSGSFDSAREHIKSSLSKTLCAFLNTSGGSFWVGVHNDRTINGIHLTSAEVDKLSLAVNNALTDIQPQPFRHINAKFVPLYGASDTYVLQIIVRAPQVSGSSEAYKAGGKVYTRVLTSTRESESV